MLINIKKEPKRKIIVKLIDLIVGGLGFRRIEVGCLKYRIYTDMLDESGYKLAKKAIGMTILEKAKQKSAIFNVVMTIG